MYKEKFVTVVKSNGKILREHDGIVTLPFQSEYSILMKNLESRKAEVKITIDGKDVLDGSILVMPNSTFELEGFLSGYRTTNKFKFIQKTKEIIEHRGDKIDDGLIRVEFVYEKAKPERKQIIHDHIHYCSHCYCYPCVCHKPWHTTSWYYSGSTLRTSSPNFTVDSGATGGGKGQTTTDAHAMYNCSLTSDNLAGAAEGQSRGFAESINFVSVEPLVDEGITVKGSESNQRFSIGTIGELEENSNVIIIKLRGTDSVGEEVKKPVTVNTKVTCETCGKRSRSSAKFCNNCGTALF